MKRIIITERQYKRLVDQPLNKEDTDFDIELDGYSLLVRWNNVNIIQNMLRGYIKDVKVFRVWL